MGYWNIARKGKVCDSSSTVTKSKSARDISTIRYLHLDRLFDDSEIEENYRHPQLQHKSGLPMELDIFLPKEQLAFEYQGEHHFHDVYHMGIPWHRQRQRDEEKRKACRENEITLIEVPYWWNKETSTLAATIRKERNDLIPNSMNGEQSIPTMKEYLIHSEGL